MRRMLAVLLLTTMPGLARSDPPGGVPVAEGVPVAGGTIQWTKPFASIPAVERATTLVMLVVSNDDPVSVVTDSSDSSTTVEAPLWCESMLAESLRSVAERRPDLAGRLVLQPLAAGMPAALTGGKPDREISRVVLMVADGEGHMLGFRVGLPDVEELLTLIEDAEEVGSLSQMLAGGRQPFLAAVVRRSQDRLGVRWRESLDRLLVAWRTDQAAASEPSSVTANVATRISAWSEAYDSVLRMDIRNRFAIIDDSDRSRLVKLEQHAQTRRPWVEAITPCVVGADMATVWKPLCQSIWGQEPISGDATAADLLPWWDAQIAVGPVVLRLSSTPDVNQPDVDRTGRRRDPIGWNDVEALVETLSVRDASANELFALLDSRDLKPVELRQPSRARYLLFVSKQRPAIVAREGDPPVRFFSQLKRAIR